MVSVFRAGVTNIPIWTVSNGSECIPISGNSSQHSCSSGIAPQIAVRVEHQISDTPSRWYVELHVNVCSWIYVSGFASEQMLAVHASTRFPACWVHALAEIVEYRTLISVVPRWQQIVPRFHLYQWDDMSRQCASPILFWSLLHKRKEEVAFFQ